MVICYLGLGSNLGDRRKNIRLALQKINRLEGTAIIKLSKIIESKPQGGPGNQRDFLNAVLKIKTNFSALGLLRKLKTIEKDLGRVKGVRNGPRTIDLDILFYRDTIINTKKLKIPHPRMFERDFVMKPLLEVI